MIQIEELHDYTISYHSDSWLHEEFKICRWLQSTHKIAHMYEWTAFYKLGFTCQILDLLEKKQIVFRNFSFYTILH